MCIAPTSLLINIAQSPVPQCPNRLLKQRKSELASVISHMMDEDIRHLQDLRRRGFTDDEIDLP
jgi:hypothetical protein